MLIEIDPQILLTSQMNQLAIIRAEDDLPLTEVRTHFRSHKEAERYILKAIEDACELVHTEDQGTLFLSVVVFAWHVIVAVVRWNIDAPDESGIEVIRLRTPTVM
jgi:hypothetical protein